MGKMSREDLFREIGKIDESYVEEAQRVRKPRGIVTRTGRALVAAASLALCVGAGYLTLQLIQPGGSMSDGTNSAAGANGGTMEAAQEACYSMAEDTAVADAVSEDAGAVVAGAVSGESDMEAPRENALTEAAEQRAPGAGESKVESDGLATVTEAESLKQDVNSSPTVETLGEETAVEDMGGLWDNMLSGGDTEELTWEEARADTAFGSYVDIQVPEGYSYTGGSRSESALRVIWNRGMEEISVTCRQADEDVSDWLVDVEKPEEYDLALYSIPWCDSVPPQLHTQVFNATFRPDQVTLQTVSARTYQVQEAGDVSGSRTQIGILYDGNVLVEIRSKGPSAEEIYALINLEN